MDTPEKIVTDAAWWGECSTRTVGDEGKKVDDELKAIVARIQALITTAREEERGRCAAILKDKAIHDCDSWEWCCCEDVIKAIEAK